MSLINDALKRARQTQQENPPPIPPLQLKPAEPEPLNPRRTPLLWVGLGLLLVLVVALGGLVIWLFAQKSAGELRAAARPAADPVAAVPVATSPALAPAPALAGPDTNTNTPAVAAPGPSPAPAPKLQGIAYRPDRPTAVVNGRTVEVGDRVGGFRVLAISRSAVTLGDATVTNVLSLSE